MAKLLCVWAYVAVLIALCDTATANGHEGDHSYFKYACSGSELTQTEYADATCETTTSTSARTLPYSETGFPDLDTCSPEGDRSMKYTCQDGFLVTLVYITTDCSGTPFQQLGPCYVVDDSDDGPECVKDCLQEPTTCAEATEMTSTGCASDCDAETITHLLEDFCGSASAVASDAKCGCEVYGEKFCNFDDGESGSCEHCSEFSTEENCGNAGLPDKGAADCVKRCFTGAPPPPGTASDSGAPPPPGTASDSGVQRVFMVSCFSALIGFWTLLI